MRFWIKCCSKCKGILHFLARAVVRGEQRNTVCCSCAVDYQIQIHATTTLGLISWWWVGLTTMLCCNQHQAPMMTICYSVYHTKWYWQACDVPVYIIYIHQLSPLSSPNTFSSTPTYMMMRTTRQNKLVLLSIFYQYLWKPIITQKCNQRAKSIHFLFVVRTLVWLEATKM